MAKTKISEYDATAANNTDVDSVNIAEGCAPSGINNAIREVMSHLKEFQTGAAGDSLTVGGTLTSGTVDINGGAIDGTTIGASSASTGSFTNLTATGTVTIPDNAISGDKVEGGTINAITINTLSGNVSVTGNTTLGDASTDSVTVNGYMGVGGAGASTSGLFVGSTALTGTTQVGANIQPVVTSAATSGAWGTYSAVKTAAASFTLTGGVAFYAPDATKGAGSTITNLHGVYIADQTKGTNNYGVTIGSIGSGATSGSHVGVDIGNVGGVGTGATIYAGIRSGVVGGTNKWNIYASGTAANYFAGSIGIGTNSPSAKIDILAGTGPGVRVVQNYVFAGANYAIAVSGNGSTAGYIAQTPAAGGLSLANGQTYYGGGPWRAESTSASAINQLGGNIIFTANTGLTAGANFTPAERLRIDSAGNLGLGVTPSAATRTTFQIGAYGTIDNNGGTGIEVNSNAVYNSGWKYIASAAATQYYQYNGAHAWRTAASGTADSAITFSQAMTLDADGDLGVGITSPLYRLHINSGTVNTVAVFESTDATAIIGFKDNSTTNIPSIGAVADAMIFNTGAAERARIDSSGNLLVGTTSIDPRNIITESNGHAIKGVTGAVEFASSDATAMFINGTNSVSSALTFIAFRQRGSSRGSISTNGTSTSYNTTSDYRLKENWVAVADASTRVNALKPVNFAWKADGSRVDGFLAHELAEVVPEAVTGTKDAVDAEGNPEYQGIDQSKLVPLLTAALQEALAEINALKARLDAANL